MKGQINFKEIKGCCLDCPNGYEGCLCYDCKCKKCYWYIENNLIDMDLVDKPCGYKFGKEFENILINLVRTYLRDLIKNNENHRWDYEYRRFELIGLIPEDERV